MEAGLKEILDFWLSQGNIQNLGTPAANKFAGTRNGILNNFLGQSQYNTTDELSKNYPWMPPLAPALNILDSMAPGMRMQEGPIPELMRQNAARKAEAEQQANLRQQMLAANMQQQAATPPPAVPASAAPAPAPAPAAPPAMQFKKVGINSDPFNLSSRLAMIPQSYLASPGQFDEIMVPINTPRSLYERDL